MESPAEIILLKIRWSERVSVMSSSDLSMLPYTVYSTRIMTSITDVAWLVKRYWPIETYDPPETDEGGSIW